MHESDAYYEEILYPLQNGVLSTLAACEAPFYLTGGTALHRYYFGFRYSDDLQRSVRPRLVTQQQTTLKIDFVNDSAPRFGAGEFTLPRALNRFGERPCASANGTVAPSPTA